MEFFLPILVLIILIWSSVWYLFQTAIEATPHLSFRVIIDLPALKLLLFFGLKKVRKVYIPKNNWKSLILISFLM